MDLAQIAQELDALERALLGGEALAEAGNVDASGMFSSQVLSKALEVWGLSATPITSPDMRGVAEEPQREAAFICNLEEHWFTIRVVEGGVWFNFNSIYPAPEVLGTFYLAAYLAGLKQQGYTVYVIRGELPRVQPPAAPGPAGNGVWWTIEEAKAANEAAATARHRGKVANVLEDALGRAAAGGGTLTLRSKRAATGPAGGEAGDDEDADLARAIAASLGQDVDAQPGPSAGGPAVGGGGGGGSWLGGGRVRELGGGDRGIWGDIGLGGGPGPMDRDDMDSVGAVVGGGTEVGQGVGGSVGRGGGLESDAEFFEDDDPELAAAIAASLERTSDAAGDVATAVTPLLPAAPAPPPSPPLEQEPEAGPGVVELAFRLPGGARAARRFPTTAPMSQLYSYLEHEHHLQPSSHIITTQFPRKEVGPGHEALAAVGLGERQMLNVEVRR